MPLLKSPLFKSISILSLLTFTWTFILAPAAAHARLATPQSQSDVGAVNAIAGNDGVVAYGSGKYVKYSDGVTQFGQIELDAEVLKLIQPGNRTYAVDKNGKFYVIDSSDTSNPTRKGTYQLPAGKCTDLDQHDANTIVVMNQNDELSRVDVTDENNPTCTSQAGMGTQFESANGTAVVSGDGMMCKLDTSGNDWAKGAQITTGHTAISIDPAGDKVYTGGGGEVRAYDLAGAIPVLIATFVIFGTFLSLVASANSNQVWVCFDQFGSIAYMLLSLAAAVFTELHTTFGVFKGIPSLAVDPLNPALLLVAIVAAGVVFNYSGGTINRIYSFLGAEYFYGMALLPILATLFLFASVGHSGIHIYNMNNPIVPLFIFALVLVYAARAMSFYQPGAALRAGPANSAAGPYGVIAASERGFMMYDLQDPGNPVKTDEIFTGGLAYDVEVVGDVAYGADGIFGMQVIDIVDPANIQVLTTVATSAEATGVLIAGSHAYLAASSAGVRIIDISTPASAAEVSTMPSLTNVTSMATDGTYLYFGQANSVQIYDLVDPTAPAFVGSYALPGGAVPEEIAIVDVPGAALKTEAAATKYAYVAGGSSGFVIVDVSNPALPVEAATVPATDASSIAVDGNDVYLGDGGDGFVVLNVDASQVPVFFQDVSVTFRDRGVDLSWAFSSDEIVTGIDVYRSGGSFDRPIRLNHDPLPPGQREFRDTRVEAGATYQYTVIAHTESGRNFPSPASAIDVPMREMSMFPNYPNPFNPSTTVSFDLPSAEHVRLAIYDAAGRLVVTLLDQRVPAGVTEVQWSGRNAQGTPVGSGVYLAKLEAAGRSLTSKLTLLK